MEGCSPKEEPKTKTEDNQGATSLTIIIQDDVNNKELFNGNVSVKGKVKTLEQFLKKADELDVEMEDGEYGVIITSMKGVEIEDINSGPVWVYESTTNPTCVAAGHCDNLGALEIEHGDKFIFTYVMAFG